MGNTSRTLTLTRHAATQKFPAPDPSSSSPLRTIADSDVGRMAHSLACSVFLTSTQVAWTAAMTISTPSELGRDVMAASSQMRGSLFVLRSGRASN
ncbi:hypothetical protein PaG_04970 [Moesziomyces aphidis]|uniref:Uncharacterized protein n=1 Tax=Moesziomyces aphidis TaxID=84754 RepID=W3VH98_MOEAP|nr:hypothetical protein PaG_04970 [Moesziomyces aphidis]